VRVCVLGAGGLGLVLGAGLARSGVQVTLVARPAHVAAIRARGVRLSGIRGEHAVREGISAVASAGEAQGEFDCLIVCVKARDTDAALEQAAALRARTAAALSLQNSVRKDARLAAWIGAARVIGAATTEAGTLIGPGEARHTGSAPVSTYFGELDGSSARKGAARSAGGRVAQLVDAFSKAGFPARSAGDIRQVEWEKLMQAAAIGGWSAALLGAQPRGSVAQALCVREAAEHYVTLARELLDVYRGRGYAPRDFFAPYARFRELAAQDFETAVASAQALGREMRERGAIGRHSLHEDLIHGRPTELDEIIGPFLDEARRLGLAVPTVQAVYRTIRALEQLRT
jgi:2-dehydropantoate 2-reductase